MNIEIRKLTSDLAEEYAHFFDVTPHDDHSNKDELPCYCVTWRTDDTYASDENGNWNHWFATREEGRERAIQFIKAGSLQGYLAYHGDKIVGWCNANTDCRGCVDYLRDFYPIEEYRPDIRVKSIFCFVIAPEMQRKGIAAQLVERVCSDAAADGFDFVEAYPNVEHTALDFRGPLAMYEKCGFAKSVEQDGRVVVRKALK
jgi:GNAT superfamily N-acetyltransferase